MLPDRDTSNNCFNPLSANPTKWSSTLKQFVGKLPTNCLSVFDHFVKLALKELMLRICHLEVFLGKGVLKHKANLQENTMPKFDFNKAALQLY